MGDPTFKELIEWHRPATAYDLQTGGTPQGECVVCTQTTEVVGRRAVKFPCPMYRLAERGARQAKTIAALTRKLEFRTEQRNVERARLQHMRDYWFESVEPDDFHINGFKNRIQQLHDLFGTEAADNLSEGLGLK